VVGFARGVGEAMGTSENTARMRVTRALEKLQGILRNRGIALSAAALGAALANDTVAAAPSGLAAGVSAAALAGAKAGAVSTVTLFKLITMTKLQAVIIGAAAIAGVAYLAILQQNQVKLRQDNGSLRQQIGQLTQLTAENKRLSELLARAKRAAIVRPQLQSGAPAANSSNDESQTANLARILKSDTSARVTAEQIAPYLKANHRNAGSLIAAFRATGDAALLEEAMANFPDDPQVAFVAIHKKDASPQERRLWLDAFKKSDPGNSVGNYLSAFDFFKNGQPDQAVQELGAASGKPVMQDFSLDFMQNSAEAYRAAGYSADEAKVVASISLVLPHLIELKQLNQSIVDLANSYRQAGDEASAKAALQMDVNLGRRLGDQTGSPTLISQLVGIAIESNALKAMDPSAPLGDSGQTAQQRIEELAQSRAAAKELAQQFTGIEESMSPQDWSSYVDRLHHFGEQAAMRWLIAKYGQK